MLGGICERHPNLRVAFLEGTGGWIVPMLQRFDHQFEIFGSADQKTLPSEVFARQCMISFDPDEVALAFTAEHLGADKILWASDYPHPDAKIPGVVKELKEAVKPLAPGARADVMGGSARPSTGCSRPVRQLSTRRCRCRSAASVNQISKSAERIVMERLSCRWV